MSPASEKSHAARRLHHRARDAMPMKRSCTRTSTQVDRDYPHQVALRADEVKGRNYEVVHGFCRGLSVAPRGGYFRHQDVDYVVFCFREEQDAALFCAEFDGERGTPRRRARRRSHAQDWKSR